MLEKKKKAMYLLSYPPDACPRLVIGCTEAGSLCLLGGRDPGSERIICSLTGRRRKLLPKPGVDRTPMSGDSVYNSVCVHLEFGGGSVYSGDQILMF